VSASLARQVRGPTWAASSQADPPWQRRSPDSSLLSTQLNRVHEHITDRANNLHVLATTSTEDRIERALAALPQKLPEQGLGLQGAYAFPNQH